MVRYCTSRRFLFEQFTDGTVTRCQIHNNRYYHDPELRPWGNSGSCATAGSCCRFHRSLHISQKWYALLWVLHSRDTQTYRSRLEHIQQADRHLEAVKIENAHEDAAFHSLVISVLLYVSETWILTKADERRLEAFHMNCQRRILGIRWFHFVTNTSVTSQTGEEDMASRIRRRRLYVFSHVRRLPEVTPAHSALRLVVDISRLIYPTTDWSGNADKDDPTERGCIRLKKTVGLTSMTPGGSRMAASLGGRYDPSSSSGPVSEWVML